MATKTIGQLTQATTINNVDEFAIEQSGVTKRIAASVVREIANGAVTAAKLDGAQTGSAPIYGCRAWVNFDGTRDTSGNVSTANTNRLIRSSGNVSSVARNGTGGYLITFTTSMQDANYTAVATALWTGGPYFAGPTSTAAFNTGSLQIQTGSTAGGTAADVGTISVAIFR